ncbi:unnamed protein product [Auanema sp. JU1783]|nr:unnamed protein product [Auanema sp. JU1783]
MTDINYSKLSSNQVGQYLSGVCQGLTKEERRRKLNEILGTTESTVTEYRQKLTNTKEKIERARAQYENFTDLVQTMENLKVSLEEHIRTVKINKGSLDSIPAVLQHDKGKERTQALISIIKAVTQIRIIKENFKKESEDQRVLFESLLEMQQSRKILHKFLKEAVEEDKIFEDLKDQFFAWQSTALIFAIQQADYVRMTEIQHSYEAMDRQDEFLLMFKQVSINCLKEFHFDSSSMSTLVEGLHKQMDFIFTHQYQILRRFLDDDKAHEMIVEAMNLGLDACDLTTPLTLLISDTDNILKIMDETTKIMFTLGNKSESKLTFKLLQNRLAKEMNEPMQKGLISFMIKRVSAMDEIGQGSFRTRVESLKTSISSLFALMHDVIERSRGCFGTKFAQIVETPVNKTLDNFLSYLQKWKSSIDKSSSTRSVSELISICSASGYLLTGMEDIERLLDSEISIASNMKNFKKWNKSVVESVLKASCESITGKMKTKMEEMKRAPPSAVSNANLPTFTLFPHEYITTAGQDMLQLFHNWDKFFLDENVAYSFFVAYKGKFKDDELFKRTVNEVADRVMKQFIATIAEPASLAVELSRQFYTDAGFLKDALEDLRAGNTADLEELREKLKKVGFA